MVTMADLGQMSRTLSPGLKPGWEECSTLPAKSAATSKVGMLNA